MAIADIAAKPGRPRCFCEDVALEAAMRVFWEKGYEGASLTDLTEAMGINRPSLYAAFGDKKSLFLKAMARYAEGPASYIETALAEPTARRVIESLLRGSAKLMGDPGSPRGCLSVQGALASGADAEPVKNALIAWRKAAETRIKNRLKRAQTEGDLSKDVDAADLARYVAVVANGLSVQAANGASRAEISRVAEIAIRSFPI